VLGTLVGLTDDMLECGYDRRQGKETEVNRRRERRVTRSMGGCVDDRGGNAVESKLELMEI
jgi:hypothetical protein